MSRESQMTGRQRLRVTDDRSIVRGKLRAPEESEAGAVESVRAALGDNIDRARGRQIGADIQRRLLNSEFLHRFIGQVHYRGADRFIGNIDSIHLDAGGTAGTASDGDAGHLVLRGIEKSAVHDLHTRRQSGPGQESCGRSAEDFRSGSR